MKRLLMVALTVVCLTLVGLAAPVRAQETPTLASLELALWPEFDRSEVLVIYRGELDAGVALPAAVDISLPARVGQPTALAYVDEAGDRFNQQYTTRVEGDRLVVSFALGTRRFQLEYYDALPADTTGRRSYTFAYTADYATAVLNLEVQQPPTAEGFALAPPADTTMVAQDGLTYHLAQAGALAAGDTREWTFAYLKNDTALTADGLAQAETLTPAATTAAGGGAGDTTVWIFLVAFVALIAVGATGFWLGHRAQPALMPAQPGRGPRSAPQKRRGSGRGDRVPQQRLQMPPQWRSPDVREARFCHNCGAELRSDAVFCHECGTSVRGR